MDTKKFLKTMLTAAVLPAGFFLWNPFIWVMGFVAWLTTLGFVLAYFTLSKKGDFAGQMITSLQRSGRVFSVYQQMLSGLIAALNLTLLYNNGFYTTFAVSVVVITYCHFLQIKARE